MKLMAHMRAPTLNRAGYSLFELLTVLVIIGIGASVAAPAVGTYMDQSRTRRAVDRLVADLAYTRLLAVSEGRKSAVRFEEGGVYRIESQVVGGGWTTRRTVSLSTQFPGVAFVAGASDIEFSSRGLVSNLGSEAVVKLSSNEVTDSVRVSLAGRTYRAY